LGAVAFLMVVVLLSVIVDGTFTNDEGHYTLTILGLRDGTFVHEATRGLMASRELLLPSMSFPQTPITPLQPPLYAFVALPLSTLGWPALIGLNAVAFVATGVMVHQLAARTTAARGTPWLALGIYWLAGFSVEYALGMWPHCLAVALVTGALWCLLVARDVLIQKRPRRAVALAAAGGLLMGVATGVRYQEIVFAGLAALGVVVTLPWCRERGVAVRAAAVLSLGLVLGLSAPLAGMSLINHSRIGTYNPVTKSSSYTSLPKGEATHGGGGAIRAALDGFVVRVLDYAQKPTGRSKVSTRVKGEPLVYAGVAKKALLQSAPWLALPLLTLPLAWRRRRPVPDDAADAEHRRNRQLDGRVYGVVLFGLVALFSVIGPIRTSGFCFNMRYLLEIVPLAAVAAAWALEGMGWHGKALMGGAAVGGGLAAVSLVKAHGGDHGWIMGLSLLLAIVVALAFGVRRHIGPWAVAAVALGLGWAAVVHLADDTRASLQQRAEHGHVRDVLERHLNDEPSALFAYWGNTTPFYPLQLDHSLVLVDPFMDGGETARPLMDQLLERGARVLVLVERMPPRLLEQMLSGRAVRRLPERELLFLEVRGIPSSPAAAPHRSSEDPADGTAAPAHRADDPSAPLAPR